MSKATNRVIQSTQEQAVAAWIYNLRLMRTNELVEALRQQNINLTDALEVLNNLKSDVDYLISSNRGGEKGIHGFIAEVTECDFSNARMLIEGLQANCDWINDNGPADLFKEGIKIQQKFVKSGGHFGLEAIREHLNDYPDFINNGGKYQIPSDFYEKVKKVSNMTQEELKKLSNSKNADITYRQAKWIKEFFDETGVTIDDIEPSLVDYSSVQKGKIYETIDSEKKNIYRRNDEKVLEGIEKSKPTFSEGLKAAGVGAVAEGGMSFALGIVAKRKEGKKLSEFDENDWKDIGLDTALGTVKGGIRGGVVYMLSNFTVTRENIASAYVTALFGVAAQTRALNKGEISKDEYLLNCEVVCLDVTMSAVSSLIGQTVIPIPVLGAVIGNLAGQFVYEIGKKVGSRYSQKIVENYCSEISALNEKLDCQYKMVVEKIMNELKKFTDLEELAFSNDVNIAFKKSRELALSLGVEEKYIFNTVEEVDTFFLN